MLEYFPELMKGLHTSLTLKTPVLVWIVRGYITLFTGTPLLVQIFLIYYGPGQFPSLQE
ncbi:MAG: arginine ABC transporter permease ArtM, partial [Leclercia adecarboxylata]|nr:arginine ABC transporter permease ArtM [Leclercia adecarboxylata]MDU1108025.1 arginine ABC transporter permease ArtM [Enterobacter sp.]